MNHPLGVGNAMNNLVVDAGANAGRETVVALETGGSTHLTDPFFSKCIQITGGLTGLHHLHHFAEDRRNDATGLAHDLDFAR